MNESSTQKLLHTNIVIWAIWDWFCYIHIITVWKQSKRKMESNCCLHFLFCAKKIKNVLKYKCIQGLHLLVQCKLNELSIWKKVEHQLLKKVIYTKCCLHFNIILLMIETTLHFAEILNFFQSSLSPNLEFITSQPWALVYFCFNNSTLTVWQLYVILSGQH